MAQPTIDRRRILTGAGALGAAGVLGTLAAPIPARAAPHAAAGEDKEDKQGLEGSWVITVTGAPGPNAGPPYKALVTFAAGGGLVETDERDADPSGPSSPGHGSWVRTAEQAYRLTLLKFTFDPKGRLLGIVSVAASFTLQEGATAAGDTLSGTDTVTVFDPSGKPLAPPSNQTIAGKRISA